MTLQMFTMPLFFISQSALFFIPGVANNLLENFKDFSSFIEFCQPLLTKFLFEFIPSFAKQMLVNFIAFDTGSFIEHLSLSEIVNQMYIYFLACIDFIQRASILYTTNLPGYFWGMQIFWCLVVVASWHMTMKLQKKFFPIWKPLGCYVWLWRKIFAGKMWRVCVFHNFVF